MTTLFPADGSPPIHIPPPTAQTIRECLLEKLLRECLPDLQYVELGSRTSAERRNLIAQIEHVTRQERPKPKFGDIFREIVKGDK